MTGFLPDRFNDSPLRKIEVKVGVGIFRINLMRIAQRHLTTRVDPDTATEELGEGRCGTD